MGRKYIIELLDDCPNEFKGIIVFGLTPEGQIAAEPIPVEDLTPYTAPDLDAVRKEAYYKGYETAKHECEDCNTNIVVEAIRKKAYEKAYEQGRKNGKIEGQAETWVCVKKIAFKPEIAECVDDLVRIGFDVGTADSWSEAIELLFEKYSASEVIEKIRQYEQEKEEIQVGDEVEAMAGNAVVIEVIDGGQTVRYMYPDTITGRNKACNVTRTGRHFPQIAEVLQKMKES